jgi:hypothetical protein
MPLFQYTQGNLATLGYSPSATLNPYKYFADGLGKNGDLWTFLKNTPGQFGVFGSGIICTRNYYLRFPNSKSVKFGYAIVANWEAPDVHPSNAPEAVACSVVDSSDVYYVSPTTKGGNLILDISVWDWGSAVSSAGMMEDYKIFVESTVLSSVHQFSTGEMTPVGGDENYSTYHVEIPADNILSPDGNEYWVIVEQTGFDYTNEFGVTNLAGNDALAALFRYELYVSSGQTNPTVTSIEPDHADQHSFVSDAVISGTNFVNVTSVRLEKGADIIEADTFTVDSATQITADFDLMGYPYGLYDVVVEVQGGLIGKLADGFEIILKCGTTSPSLDNVYALSPNTNSNYLCAILNAGPYEGYTIYSETNTNVYRVFNHMTQANNTPITDWTAFQAWGNPLVLEIANENGLAIVCSAYVRQYWQVLSQTTGAVKQTLSVGYDSGTVGDFDGNDDFWGIAVRRPNPGLPDVYEYYLQHWAYTGSASNPYTFDEEMDVTSLFRDEMSATSKWEVFGDLVMDPGGDYCYVLTGELGTDPHKVDKLDLTGSVPTIVASYSFAGEGLRDDGQIDIARSYAVKMELDISDPNLIPCRLVVAGTQFAESGNTRYLNIYRFDGDLNLFDKATYEYNIASGDARIFYGMALDMENKVIVHLTQITSTSFPPPLYPGYYGISKLPADW